MAMRATAQFSVGLGDAEGDDSTGVEHPASAVTDNEAMSKPTPRVPSLLTRPG